MLPFAWREDVLQGVHAGSFIRLAHQGILWKWSSSAGAIATGEASRKAEVGRRQSCIFVGRFAEVGERYLLASQAFKGCGG